MKKSGIIIGLALTLATFATPAFADNCQPIYGGGTSCAPSSTVNINKMVQNPQTGQFVDNLSVSDPRFQQGNTITFELIVKNTGDSQIGRTTVQDTLPQFVNFVSGPGSFDNGSKVISFDVFNLAAGESRTFTIQASADANSIPSNQGMACVTNVATANADNGQGSQDTASFCIEKNTTPTKGGLTVFPAPKVNSTPPTGAEAMSLLTLIPSSVAGLLLRRKSKGSK